MILYILLIHRAEVTSEWQYQSTSEKIFYARANGGLLAGHFSGAKLYQAVSRLRWRSALSKDVMEW